MCNFSTLLSIITLTVVIVSLVLAFLVGSRLPAYLVDDDYVAADGKNHNEESKCETRFDFTNGFPYSKVEKYLGNSVRGVYTNIPRTPKSKKDVRELLLTAYTKLFLLTGRPNRNRPVIKPKGVQGELTPDFRKNHTTITTKKPFTTTNIKTLITESEKAEHDQNVDKTVNPITVSTKIVTKRKENIINLTTEVTLRNEVSPVVLTIEGTPTTFTTDRTPTTLITEGTPSILTTEGTSTTFTTGRTPTTLITEETPSTLTTEGTPTTFTTDTTTTTLITEGTPSTLTTEGTPTTFTTDRTTTTLITEGTPSTLTTEGTPTTFTTDRTTTTLITEETPSTLTTEGTSTNFTTDRTTTTLITEETPSTLTSEGTPTTLTTEVVLRTKVMPVTVTTSETATTVLRTTEVIPTISTTNQSIPTIQTTNKFPNEKLRGMFKNLMTKYPYVISLTAPDFKHHNFNVRLYAGMGVILSEHWALTSTSSVLEKAEWRFVTARSGSWFWHRGGFEHIVTDMSTTPRDGLVVIKVQPPFPISYKRNSRVQPINYPLPYETILFDQAVTVGWNTKLHHVSTVEANSTNLNIKRWSLNPCPTMNMLKICSEIEVDQELSAQPLVTKCDNYLLGMVIGKNYSIINVNQKDMIEFIGVLLSPTKKIQNVNYNTYFNCLPIYEANCYFDMKCKDI